MAWSNSGRAASRFWAATPSCGHWPANVSWIARHRDMALLSALERSSASAQR